MKVKDLIRELSELPEESHVTVWTSGGYEIVGGLFVHDNDDEFPHKTAILSKKNYEDIFGRIVDQQLLDN